MKFVPPRGRPNIAIARCERKLFMRVFQRPSTGCLRSAIARQILMRVRKRDGFVEEGPGKRDEPTWLRIGLYPASAKRRRSARRKCLLDRTLLRQFCAFLSFLSLKIRKQKLRRLSRTQPGQSPFLLSSFLTDRV